MYLINDCCQVYSPVLDRSVSRAHSLLPILDSSLTIGAGASDMQAGTLYAQLTEGRQPHSCTQALVFSTTER